MFDKTALTCHTEAMENKRPHPLQRAYAIVLLHYLHGGALWWGAALVIGMLLVFGDGLLATPPSAALRYAGMVVVATAAVVALSAFSLSTSLEAQDEDS